MRKARQTILYALAAALLVTTLFLAVFPTDATAHYVIEASWQGDYVSDSPIRSSILQADGALYRLQTRSPAAQTEIPLSFDLTCRNTGAAAVSVGIQAEIIDGNSCLSVRSGTGPVSVPADGSQKDYTVVLLAERVTSKTTARVTISAECDEDTLFATFQITLLPAGTSSSASAAEKAETGLFVDSASMDTYTWGKPICISYAIEHDGAVTYRQEDGTFGEFPRFTVYRIGNGETVTLYEPDTIALSVGSGVLILNFDRVAALTNDPPEIGLKISLSNGNAENRTIRPTAISTHQNQVDKNGIPSVYVVQMDKCGVPEITVERLAPGKTSSQSPHYETVTKQVELNWGDRDALGGRYVTVAPKDGELPAGSYRMTLTWFRDTTVVYRQKCGFYVNYF